MSGMPESEKQILEEVAFFRDKYFTYDEPVPFVDGLKLYPVDVRHYNEFLSCSSCCTLNKNDDPKGISQSHLDYLISKMKDPEDGNLWTNKFSILLGLCLHVQNGLKCSKCGKYKSYEEYFVEYQSIESQKESLGEAEYKNKINSLIQCSCGEDSKLEPVIQYKIDDNTKKTILLIDGHKINNKDFSKFRKYVMYQNLPDFKDDSWVDKAVRDDQAAKAELMSRNGGTASLERKIIGVCANTSYQIEEIYDMSIRKFMEILSMVDDVINYTANRIGMMTGMVSFKKGETIPHWLYKKETGLYDKAIDADAYTAQFKQ